MPVRLTSALQAGGWRGGRIDGIINTMSTFTAQGHPAVKLPGPPAADGAARAAIA